MQIYISNNSVQKCCINKHKAKDKILSRTQGHGIIYLKPQN